MRTIALQFGFLILACFALLQVTRYTLFTQRLVDEAWTALFALIFVVLGLGLYRYFGPVREVKVPVEVPLESASAPMPSPASAEEKEKRSLALGISKREYEVLTLIAQGLSNQQIAGQLYISESTVKSHVSKLLVKLEAKRRTQAVSKAQQVGIL